MYQLGQWIDQDDSFCQAHCQIGGDEVQAPGTEILTSENLQTMISLVAASGNTWHDST